MEHKGYLTDDGRVVTSTRPATSPGHARRGCVVAADGAYVVGEVHYDEQRYNLRRVVVSRTWYVTPYPRVPGDVTLVRDRAIAAADTRAKAIAAALARLGR